MLQVIHINGGEGGIKDKKIVIIIITQKKLYASQACRQVYINQTNNKPSSSAEELSSR